MSPLGIEILLHYHCRVDDFRSGDFSAPAVRDLIDAFTSEGMLIPNATPGYHRTYQLSERGETYVNALCRVPYPINKWCMPDGFEALLTSREQW